METSFTEAEERKITPAPAIDYSFPDLVDVADLQDLMEHFSKLTGLPIGILDSDNKVLAAAGWQKACTCFHRVHPETCKYCMESDSFIRQNLKTENPIAYKCKNGLWDMAYPIIIEKKHVATMFFGQFFYEDEEMNEEQFLLQAEKYGFDKEEYLEALRQVPRISREKEECLKRFSAVLSKMLTHSGYSNLLLKKEKIDELKNFNELLQNLVQKTYDLNVTKDKFFSIIAHDLRNPFATLLSSSQLLLTYIKKGDPVRVEGKARMIYTASKHAYTLLENLLEWARSQTGAIKLTPACLDLNNLVTECLDEVEELASSKSIELINSVPGDISLNADKYMLRVILRNLVTNAIKYTHSGGSVTIKATRYDGVTEMVVKDTGIGIAKEHHDKLFRIDTNFTQLGTANEKGSSLGLILCKEFIEKHNGRIWVESEINRGSEFKFSIPDTK